MWFPQINKFSETAGNCIDILPEEIAKSVCLNYGMVENILVQKELVEYSIFEKDKWFRFYFLTGFDEKTGFYKCLLLWNTSIESQAKTLGLAYGSLANYICDQVFALLFWNSSLTFREISDYQISISSKLH